MKVTVERDALAPALDTAFACVMRKPVLAINGCFRLTAEGKALRITANDLDSSIAVTIAADVARPGDVAVTADTLRSIVKASAQGAQAVIDAEPTRSTLRISRSRYSLATVPTYDFPSGRSIPEDDRTVEFDLSGEDAARLFAAPRAFVATEANQLTMAGTWLHMHEGRLWSIGMNHYRFFGAAIATPESLHEPEGFAFPDPEGNDRPGVVIPTQTMDGLLSALERGGRIITNGRTIIAEAANMRFAGGLIINAFPPVWAIVPRTTTHTVAVDRDEMAAALKRLNILTTKDSRLELGADPGADMLTLRMTRSSEGEGEETVRLVHEAEKGFRVAFALPILSTVFGALKGETATLSYEDRPMRRGGALVRFEDSGDSGVLAIAAGLGETGVHADQVEASDAA